MTIIIPNCNTTCLKENPGGAHTQPVQKPSISSGPAYTSTVWRQPDTDLCLRKVCMSALTLARSSMGLGCHDPPPLPRPQTDPGNASAFCDGHPPSVHTPTSQRRQAGQGQRTTHLGSPPGPRGPSADVAVQPPGAPSPSPLLASGQSRSDWGSYVREDGGEKEAIAFSAIPLSFSAT